MLLSAARFYSIAGVFCDTNAAHVIIQVFIDHYGPMAVILLGVWNLNSVSIVVSIVMTFLNEIICDLYFQWIFLWPCFAELNQRFFFNYYMVAQLFCDYWNELECIKIPRYSYTEHRSSTHREFSYYSKLGIREAQSHVLEALPHKSKCSK